jgi:anthranilate phosphoribosyltransferase
VLANAAMALHCTGNFKTYDETYNTAVESLESGKANECLVELVGLQ